MATTPYHHETGAVTSRDEDRRFYAQDVVETVHSSKVFWVDALNLVHRAMSL